MSKVEITKKVNAPIEEAFDAFTRSDLLKEWFAPEGMTTPIADVDLKVGGEYRICMQDEEGKDYCAAGQFKKIDKPTHVSYTWKWEHEKELTDISIDFKKVDDKTTEIHFVHSGLPSEESASEHNKGWSSSFNKIDNALK